MYHSSGVAKTQRGCTGQCESERSTPSLRALVRVHTHVLTYRGFARNVDVEERVTEPADNLEQLVQGAAALGITLSEGQQQAFTAYARLLLAWNERMNLLGPAAVQALWSRHLLDALTLVRALPPGHDWAGEPHSLIDVGSGAGLPGIPLHILFPHWQITLLEATGKRAQFLEHARQELELTNMLVVTGRAEDVAHDADHRAAYDLCVARAVTRTPALVELTVPFVVVGGYVVLYKTLSGLSEELQAAEPARVLLGAAPPAVAPVGTSDDGLCLVRYAKQRRTPKSLPRKAGMPEHRPLTQADAARLSEALRTEQERHSRRQSGGRPRGSTPR